MAFLQCDFFSETLKVSTSMNVVLPQATSAAEIDTGTAPSRPRYPVLYLLHGLSDDHTIWARRTSVERYAAEYGLALVMPAVQRSYYCDMAHGGAYWTFISEELPRVCCEFFPIDPARESTFACGFSMGGYGAFKLGLACGDRYAAVASLSGALDIESRLAGEVTEDSEWRAVLGASGRFAETENDLFWLAREAIRKDRPIAKLFQHVGLDDFLYEDNQRFRKFVERHPLPHTYEEVAGSHNWDYVDDAVQRVLKWLPIA